MTMKMKAAMLAAMMVASTASMAQANSSIKMSVRLVATDLKPSDGLSAGFKMSPYQGTQPSPNDYPVATEARAKGYSLSPPGTVWFDAIDRNTQWFPSSAAGHTDGGPNLDRQSDFAQAVAWGRARSYSGESMLETTALLYASASGSTENHGSLMESSSTVPGTTIELAPFTRVVFTVSWTVSGTAAYGSDTINSNVGTFTLRNMDGSLLFTKSSPSLSMKVGPYDFSEDKSASYTLTNNTANTFTGTLSLSAVQSVEMR